MCNKTDNRIECYKCGYSGSEARYLDANPPLPCDTSHENLRKHIEEREAKEQTLWNTTQFDDLY